MKRVTGNIIIENARIGFRNFSGKEGQYNPAGKRNFCVMLDDPELVQKLIDDHWNVRYLKPRDPEEKPQPYLQVAVSFEKYPPKIVVIGKHGKTLMSESDINTLDWAEIKSVDLIINPYNWNIRGDSGVKGYLKSMYITIVEDDLEDKYADIPDSAQGAIGGCGRCEVCDGHCKDDDMPF